MKNWSIVKRLFFCFGLLFVLAVSMFTVLFVLWLRSRTQPGYSAFIVFALLACVFILLVFYRWVLVPYNKTTKIIQLFNLGYTVEGLKNIRYPLTKDAEKCTLKLLEMIDRPHALKASEKQAEYLALQNQINPHFLYNTLEAIRGEALSEGMTSISEMTEALATFFRYTISKVGNLVTLEDELSNIDNYFIIQRFRFGDRLHLSVIIEDAEKEKILDYKLPKLTLQPIVENAIYHGLECKVGDGTVQIEIETTSSRLIIRVSDDGVGIDENDLERLNHKLRMAAQNDIKEERQGKGGIALANVNNRIRLLFGEQYGLHLSSTPHFGTQVEIILPLINVQ
jgi:two-component system, sensor histidine kinase YesM